MDSKNYGRLEGSWNYSTKIYAVVSIYNLIKKIHF